MRNSRLICSVLLLCPHFALDVFQWPNAWSVHWTLDREVWVRDLTGSMGCVLGQDTFLSHASFHLGV